MNHQRRTFKKDRRGGSWLRIPHPYNQGTGDKAVRVWAWALRTLMTCNPELYKKVILQHFGIDRTKEQDELWKYKYPPVSSVDNNQEPDIV